MVENFFATIFFLNKFHLGKEKNGTLVVLFKESIFTCIFFSNVTFHGQHWFGNTTTFPMDFVVTLPSLNSYWPSLNNTTNAPRLGNVLCIVLFHNNK
jgi:hypothetical protein